MDASLPTPTRTAPAAARELPADSAGRHHRSRRLAHLYASAEAESALLTASRLAGHSGMLAGVLESACAVWRGGREEHASWTDDAAAHVRLRQAVASSEVLSLVPLWVHELREIASSRPETGACTLATALELWLWTVNHFRTGAGAREAAASGALDELADALCPLIAGHRLASEIATLDPRGAAGDGALRTDLCRVHATHTAAWVGGACAELVFGYRHHLAWNAEGCATCYAADELDELEGWMPGIASGARASADVVEADGTHPAKAGPCARFDGLDTFVRLRTRLDGCLTGARFARDRVAAKLTDSVLAATTAVNSSEGRA